MKCKDCECCKLGHFKEMPNDYICTGVKHPFIIKDINHECTEYLDRCEITTIDTITIAEPELAQSFVDDDGIYIPSDYDPRYHKLLITRELFVEAYNKWIKGAEANE